jgi:hypothetical protein
MQLVIDEAEQAHIYSCLLVGGQEFSKVKKSLAKLNRDDASIDEELSLNAKLRREFNPRAEEEARERERAKRDPAQIALDEEIEQLGDVEVLAGDAEDVGDSEQSETAFPDATARVNGGPPQTIEAAAVEMGELLADEILARREAAAD